MKMIDALREAIEARDLVRLERLVDVLRTKGLDYEGIRRMAQKAIDIDAREWDALLYEMEAAE
jgi:hypothetical protein